VELSQYNASAGIYPGINEKTVTPRWIALQDGPLGDASASIFGEDTYVGIENA
jgi:hypothetical protein